MKNSNNSELTDFLTKELDVVSKDRSWFSYAKKTGKAYKIENFKNGQVDLLTEILNKACTKFGENRGSEISETLSILVNE
jgi:hypothetical protein